MGKMCAHVSQKNTKPIHKLLYITESLHTKIRLKSAIGLGTCPEPM